MPEQSGPKRGGCCAPFVGEGGSPSNTTWPGPRATSVTSGILSRPAVWLQYNNVIIQTERTDNGPTAQGEPFYKRSPKDYTIVVLAINNQTSPFYQLHQWEGFQVFRPWTQIITLVGDWVLQCPGHLPSPPYTNTTLVPKITGPK